MSKGNCAEDFLCQFGGKVNTRLRRALIKKKARRFWPARRSKYGFWCWGLVSTLALFDFEVSTLDGCPGFVFSQAQVPQCFTNTVTLRQPRKDRRTRNRRIAVSQILGKSGRRYILTKLQVRIGGELRLITSAKVVGVYMQVISQIWMSPQIIIRGSQVVAGNPRTIETSIRTPVRAIGSIAPALISASHGSVRRSSQAAINSGSWRRPTC